MMMKYLSVFVLVLSLNSIAICKTPHKLPIAWFSTNEEMQQLLEDEISSITKMRNNLKEGRQLVLELKSALQSTIEKGGTLLRNIRNQTAPANFHALKNYEESWRNMEAKWNNTGKFEVQLPVELVHRFPKVQDKMITYRSLLKHQQMFHLDTHDLAEGRIAGEVDGERLSADQCLDLGILAREDKEYDSCVSWLQQALRRSQAGEKIRANELDIFNLLRGCEDNKAYPKLCGQSGDSAPSLADNQLKCYMWTNRRHPWLLLQPVELEMYSIEPLIIRFYDVISEEEIDALKSYAKSKLYRGQVSSDDFIPPAEIDLDSIRVSSVHFMVDDENAYKESPDFDPKLVRKITKRIGYLTGSSMTNVSDLQLATYGIGGHVKGHYDADEEGDTPATFMFYLSDVKYGGATAFLSLGISISPIKGSALFWHNTLPSGERDSRTRHAGCPVLLGTKWVANKWIYRQTNDQCLKWNL